MRRPQCTSVAGLNDEPFDAIVFNTFNMPWLHEINFAPII
jgi:hypothetical protein